MLSLAQSGVFPNGSRHMLDAQDDSRKGFRKPMDDRPQECRQSGHRTSNSYLAAGWVGQELDVLHALPQLIEHCARTRQQGVSVRGELNAARPAVEKSRAQRMLEIGNHL